MYLGKFNFQTSVTYTLRNKKLFKNIIAFYNHQLRNSLILCSTLFMWEEMNEKTIAVITIYFLLFGLIIWYVCFPLVLDLENCGSFIISFLLVFIIGLFISLYQHLLLVFNQQGGADRTKILGFCVFEPSGSFVWPIAFSMCVDSRQPAV